MRCAPRAGPCRSQCWRGIESSVSNMRGDQRGVRVLRVRPSDASSGQVRHDQGRVDETSSKRERRTGVLRGRGVSQVQLESLSSNIHSSPDTYSNDALSTLRLIAATSAVVLALSSKGDITILVTLLAFVSHERKSTLGILAVGASVVFRYGTSSLEALAGAQSVLGPAGLVGPTGLALSAWLGSLCLLCAGFGLGTTPLRGDGVEASQAQGLPPSLVALALGASASVLTVGPSISRGLLLRAVSTAVGTSLTFVVASRIANERSRRWASWASLVLGLACLVLVSLARSFE